MAKKPTFGGLQGSNWKHSGMTQKRYDALAKAHAAAAALRKGSGKSSSKSGVKIESFKPPLPGVKPLPLPKGFKSKIGRMIKSKEWDVTLIKSGKTVVGYSAHRKPQFKNTIYKEPKFGGGRK